MSTISFKDRPLTYKVKVYMYEFARRLRSYWPELLFGSLFLAFLLLFASCATEVIKPSDVVEPDDLSDIAEAYCKAHPELTCGHVYVCPSEMPDDSGGAELCVLHDTPLPSPDCTPTPRHVGLCWWCCGEGCGAGCNAFSGCYCPAPPPMIDAGVDAPVEVGDLPPVHP